MYGKVIDVSKYQKNIDFTKVKEAGYKGVIIRCAYRGYGKAGTLVEDEYFYKNVAKCNEIGLPFGVYIFSQAINKNEAVEEAKFALNMIKKSGCKPSFPVYIDSEYGNTFRTGRADKLDRSIRTEIIAAFCSFVESSGYYAGLYASTSWLNTKLYMTDLKKYDVWVAHYTDKCGYTGDYGMWQYTSSGSVPGVTGRCDVNNCYKNYPSIIKNAQLNGFTEKPKLYTVTTDPLTIGDVGNVMEYVRTLGVGCVAKEIKDE